MDTSVKRVSKDRFQQAIEDNVVEGWTLKSQNENVAILEKMGGWGSLGGHVLVLIFTFWFSLGLCNLIYSFYAHYKDKKVLQIKAEEVKVVE